MTESDAAPSSEPDAEPSAGRPEPGASAGPTRRPRRRHQVDAADGARARGRHRGGADERFSAGLEALGALARDGASVSASVIDTSTGRALLAVDDTLVQPVASLGRVLLLIETAAQLEDGRLHGDRLQRMARDTATGAGLWQFLQESTMQVPDLATLVGASRTPGPRTRCSPPSASTPCASGPRRSASSGPR